MKAVVTVVGRDTVGILAKVSASCAEHNANIIDVTQSVMQELFTMVMLVDITDIKGDFADSQNFSEKMPPVPNYNEVRFSIIGEMGARNAQKHKNMTNEEKRQSLLAETEDVAEESKIYIYGNGGGRSEMADGQTEAFAVNQENDGSLTFFSNVNNKSSLKD